MTQSCTIFEIQRDIGQKSLNWT